MKSVDHYGCRGKEMSAINIRNTMIEVELYLDVLELNASDDVRTFLINAAIIQFEEQNQRVGKSENTVIAKTVLMEVKHLNPLLMLVHRKLKLFQFRACYFSLACFPQLLIFPNNGSSLHIICFNISV